MIMKSHKLIKWCESDLPNGYRVCLLIKPERVHAWLATNIWPAIIWPIQEKAMGNHPCEKFPHENYSGEDALHSNRRRSESSMALGDELNDIAWLIVTWGINNNNKLVSALSLYHRYDHDVCSVELKSIIPPKTLFVRNTRFSNAQHPSAAKLDKNRTSAFANSFIPMTTRDWNSLPATVFPTTYSLQLFKTHIHRYLRLLVSP